jgi:hypothetical protein
LNKIFNKLLKICKYSQDIYLVRKICTVEAEIAIFFAMPFSYCPAYILILHVVSIYSVATHKSGIHGYYSTSTVQNVEKERVQKEESW